MINKALRIKKLKMVKFSLFKSASGTIKITVILFYLFSFNLSTAQETQVDDPYTFKNGSYLGTGKWYKEREIAHVMGFQGMDWLERPEREAEESATTLLQNMDIKATDVIADIGAGSGYHVFRMAGLATEGTIYAVDIQDEMLFVMDEKKEVLDITNVKVIKGSEQSVNISENTLDKVLMVDVYHEFSYPFEMIQSIKKSLRPEGKIYLIEYRGEDPKVPIKKLHKMTESQAILEMKAAGFVLFKNINNLPWQHCMVFELQ
jgi:precorrin-6B methylase 2